MNMAQLTDERCPFCKEQGVYHLVKYTVRSQVMIQKECATCGREWEAFATMDDWEKYEHLSEYDF